MRRYHIAANSVCHTGSRWCFVRYYNGKHHRSRIQFIIRLMHILLSFKKNIYVLYSEEKV